jgi:hypothetical protein
VQYAAAAAVANLLPAASAIHESLIRELGDTATEIGARVIALNREYPTHAMSDAMRHVFDVFGAGFPARVFPIGELFGIYREYALEDPKRLTLFASSILCSITKIMARRQGNSQKFWDACLACCIALFSDISPLWYEDLFDVFAEIVRGVPELTAEYLALPQFLRAVIGEMVVTELDKLSEVLCALVWRAPAAMAVLPQFAAIAEIFECVLGTFGEMDTPPQRTAAVVLAQAIFEAMGAFELPRQFFGQVVAIVTELNRTVFADVIAVLATIDPIAALENECNFLIWVQHATPDLFLKSVAVLQERWGDATEAIASKGEMIQNAVARAIAQLEGAGNEDGYSGE